MLNVRSALMCCLLTLVTSSAFSQAASQPPSPSSRIRLENPNPKSDKPAQSTSPESRGTESAPIFVKSIPAPENEAETRHKEYERNEKPSLDRGLTYGTYALSAFTFLLFCFTAALWWVTYRLSKEAKTTGEAHGAKMAESISEAARAAAAQEGIANATRENAGLMQGVMQKQMRAYLVVEVGGGLYQDATKRFEVRPNLVNSGFTPALNMTYWALASILPFPLPKDHVLPVNHENIPNSMDMGPRQSLVLNAAVDTRVPDAEVDDIKHGITRRVYIWGSIRYSDIFGGVHTTDFCQSIHWIGPEGSEQIYGNYQYNKNKIT